VKIANALAIFLTVSPLFAQDSFVPQPYQVVFTTNNAIAAPSIEDCSTGLHYFVNDAAAAKTLIRENRMVVEPAGIKLEVVSTVPFYGVNFTKARVWGTDTYLWFVSAGLTQSVTPPPPNINTGKWYSARGVVSERLDYIVEQRKCEALLNDKYKEVMERLSQAERDKLRTEERAWVAAREKLKNDPKAFLESTKERIQFLDSIPTK
jgi:hypothetical protein